MSTLQATDHEKNYRPGIFLYKMSEVRALQSDPARLIHQRLCGLISPGKSDEVTLDTLCEYAWPDTASAEAMKKRRQTARKALTELSGLGWLIDEYAAKKFTIQRPTSPRKLYPS